MEWFVHGWKFEHPVHDTFFIGRLRATGRFSAQRVFVDASKASGYACEPIGDEYASFEVAQAAVGQRIAELDALSFPEPLRACQ